MNNFKVRVIKQQWEIIKHQAGPQQSRLFSLCTNRNIKSILCNFLELFCALHCVHGVKKCDRERGRRGGGGRSFKLKMHRCIGEIFATGKKKFVNKFNRFMIGFCALLPPRPSPCHLHIFPYKKVSFTALKFDAII